MVDEPRSNRTASCPPVPAAEAVAELLEVLAPDLAVRVELWDGTSVGLSTGPAVRICSVDALRRLLWAPGELGIGRAYVAGDIDIDGDVFEAIEALRPVGARLRMRRRELAALVTAARRAGVIGRPPPPPPEEARPQGVRHSSRRDARAVSHHYDVGNDFYRIVLGPSMTYSCARFARVGMTLAEAQEAKHDLVCRKLGLHERQGMRLLDVGCGWGSMAIHAAARYGARVVGVTISDSGGILWADAEGVRLKVPPQLVERMRAHAGKRITLGVRPEALHPATGADPAECCFDTTVDVVEPLGNEILIDFRAGGAPMVVRVDVAVRVKAHESIRLALDPERVHFFDEARGTAI